MANRTMPVKWLAQHADDCPHGMYLTKEREYRNKIGNLGSTTHLWIVFICQDTDCPARAIVRESDISDAIFKSGEVS